MVKFDVLATPNTQKQVFVVIDLIYEIIENECHNIEKYLII